MSIVAISPFLYPTPWLSHGYLQSAVGPYTEYTMSASTDKVAFIFRCPKGDGTDTAANRLGKVGFRLGAFTQCTNGLKVSFQDVSVTDGNPDGGVDQFSTITSGFAANAWLKAPSYLGSTGGGTGARRPVNAGDLVALVIEFSSFVSGDSLNIAAVTVAGNRGFHGNGYVNTFTNGAWGAKPFPTTTIPTVALEYDDGSYAVMDEALPAKNLASQNFNNTGTDQLALQFQFPFDCKVNGGWVALDGAGSVDFILYNSSDTAVRTINLDPDQRDRLGQNVYIIPFAEFTVPRNTDHKLSVLGKDGTNNKLIYMDVDTAAVLDQVVGGQNCRWTTKNGASPWASPTTTRRPFMGLQISAIDDGTGSGGGSAQVRFHPGMSGGMRG